MACHLEKRLPEKNQHRFYRIHVCPGVFGDWSVVRKWGRIGSPGTVRNLWFSSEAEAQFAAGQLIAKKEKGGYRTVSG